MILRLTILKLKYVDRLDIKKPSDVLGFLYEDVGLKDHMPSGAFEPKAFARLLGALTRRAPLKRALQ